MFDLMLDQETIRAMLDPIDLTLDRALLIVVSVFAAVCAVGCWIERRKTDAHHRDPFDRI
jgi:hypothetical protein